MEDQSVRCLFEIPVLCVAYLLFIKLSAHRLPISKIKQHKLNGARFKKLFEKRASAAASSMELMAAILKGTD